MTRKRSPARLVIALSIAAVLAVFLLYTSIAGGGIPSIEPGDLGTRADKVSLTGIVVGPATGDPRGAGLRFRLRDVSSRAPKSVEVVYTGSVPDQFKIGRQVVVEGSLRGQTFVATRDSMIAKCPSKYSAKPAAPVSTTPVQVS